MTFNIKPLVLATTLLASSMSQAGVINFIDLTENMVTGLGESAWTTLATSTAGVNVSITAGGAQGREYAYLDWGNAGLGACAHPYTVDVAHRGSGVNQCRPDYDDNVNPGEYLIFNFDRAVTISSIWFNNNHDGGFNAGDMVNINGAAYSVFPNAAIGSFTVAANTDWRVAYENEQFYVGGLDIHQVPEPGSLMLLGMGVFALGFMRRRYSGV